VDAGSSNAQQPPKPEEEDRIPAQELSERRTRQEPIDAGLNGLIYNPAVLPPRYLRLALLAVCLLSAVLCSGCRRKLATLTLSTKTDTFKLGGPITIQSELENVSSKEIAELEFIETQSNSLFDCQAVMRDETGGSVPETELGAKSNGHANLAEPVVSFGLRIEPKSAIAKPVKLSDLFNVQKAGKYTIQESCFVTDKQGESSPLENPTGREDQISKATRVKSNVLPIAVTN